MELVVVRLGHRIERDKRVTTHVALTARALGCKTVFLCGEKDQGVLQSVRDVAKRWGGRFSVRYAVSWKKTVKTLKKRGFCIVHATMYGEPVQKIVQKIKKNKIAIIVGAEKVPIQAYQYADHNVSVTNQPHSEVAALAIVLHELQHGKELNKTFSHARIRIKPSKTGKNVSKRPRDF